MTIQIKPLTTEERKQLLIKLEKLRQKYERKINQKPCSLTKNKDNISKM